MTEQKLISAIQRETAIRGNNRKVLILQDCTDLNYNNLTARVKKNSGLGVSAREHGLGYFLIAGIAVDAENLGIIGLADVKTWIRKADRERNEKRKDRQNKPIELKESYKWIESCNRVKAKFRDSNQVIFVQDREGDIYENLSNIGDENSDYVIRTCWNRKIEQGGHVKNCLKQEEGYKSILTINGENKGRKKREAEVEIKFKRIKINKKERTESKGVIKYPANVEVTLVEMKEQKRTVPKNEEPIVWRLWTSLPVENLKDALEVIRYYSARWLVEELFRIIKSKGFRIEESQLGNGHALRKLGVHILHAATKILQLKQARDGTTNQSIEDCFTKEERLCLKMICKTLEGKTTKQTNPYKPKQLAWGSWIISRLGGWKGYQSQRAPGVITILNGMEQFALMFQGWKIAQDVYTR